MEGEGGGKVLTVRNLSKNYASVQVYDHFDLDIEEGKITCILGESGSGKTTLLNCVAGLTPYKGEITPTDCSYIFQTPRLVPNLTVFGNLRLVCGDDRKIKEMLARVRLTEKADGYPKKLSGGQAQRVSIARAFLFGGETLLMDEPFSSLDLKLKREMTELFFELWQSDRRTVLMVTHDVDEAICMAHRIVVLREGRIVLDEKFPDEPPRSMGGGEERRLRLVSVLLDG